MAAVTGLTLVKRFTYRGNDQEEYSNTYHFKGSPPGDDASWTVLMNDVLNKESLVVNRQTFYTRAYGYNSDDPNAHHVFAHDFGPNGPSGAFLPVPTEHNLAGDQAVMAWWKMNRLNARGKPVYLRKYLHGLSADPGIPDNLSGTSNGQVDLYTNMTTGMNAVHGGLRSRSHDDSVVAVGHSGYVTTRTLKRRGKRPKTGS